MRMLTLAVGTFLLLVPHSSYSHASGRVIEPQGTAGPACLTPEATQRKAKPVEKANRKAAVPMKLKRALAAKEAEQRVARGEKNKSASRGLSSVTTSP